MDTFYIDFKQIRGEPDGKIQDTSYRGRQEHAHELSAPEGSAAHAQPDRSAD